MRLWMCDPMILCRKHILAEHFECHLFYSTLKAKKNVTGFLENNLLEPKSLRSRHDKLVAEMLNRGYKHKSPLKIPPIAYLGKSSSKKINRKEALKELLSRCPECCERQESL